MEEPKRTLQALYMGCTPVPKPSGIDVLNQALTKLCGMSAPAEWRSVNVSVAPSTVTVTDAEVRSGILARHDVISYIAAETGETLNYGRVQYR